MRWGERLSMSNKCLVRTLRKLVLEKHFEKEREAMTRLASPPHTWHSRDCNLEAILVIHSRHHNLEAILVIHSRHHQKNLVSNFLFLFVDCRGPAKSFSKK